MSAENISYDLKRFAGIKRDYTPEEVERLRGSIKIEYSMCKQLCGLHNRKFCLSKALKICIPFVIDPLQFRV